MLGLEPLHELVQSHFTVGVVDHESVPQSPVFTVVLLRGSLDGVCEGHEGKGKICKAVFEQLHFFVALHQFDQLKTNLRTTQINEAGLEAKVVSVNNLPNLQLEKWWLQWQV